MSQARKMIDNNSSTIRPGDLKVILFFGGASSMLILISAVLLFIPAAKGEDWELVEFLDNMDVERLSFIITYIVAATGLVIQTLQSYGINYLYIFELDPNHKMTPYQLYKVAIILLFLSMLACTFSLFQVKMDHYFSGDVSWAYYILMIFLIVYWCQPFFKCGYRTARK